jgi:hypothetical protein
MNRKLKVSLILLVTLAVMGLFLWAVLHVQASERFP